MLGWEDPLIENVESFRQKEHRLLRIKSFIRGANQCLPNVNQALVLSITFITVRTLPNRKNLMCPSGVQYRFTEGEFDVPDVFFALSLMSLPRLTLTGFFVLAVEIVNELIISCRRVDEFLKIPETEMTNRKNDNSIPGEVKLHQGNFGWYGQKEETKTKAPKNAMMRALSRVSTHCFFEPNHVFLCPV